MTKNKSITVDRNIRKVGEKYKANVTINGKHLSNIKRSTRRKR